ncbi:MAG TPA: autotransporter domain-containing protein [Xanthobacteraceae bacterium]
MSKVMRGVASGGSLASVRRASCLIVGLAAPGLLWPQSQAQAQCATTEPGGAGTPVNYTCATSTATNPGPNSNPNNPATSERNQSFATGIVGQVNGGVTVSVNGIALQSSSTTSGAVVSMTNNGTISNTTNGQAALVLQGLSVNNFGTFTYSGTGNISNIGTTGGSIGLSISNATGTGGIDATVSGTSTISSAADLGIQLATNTGAISLTVQSGGQVTGASAGAQIAGGGTNTLSNSGAIQATAAASTGVLAGTLSVTNSSSITGVLGGIGTTGALSLTNNLGATISGTGAGSIGIIAGQLPGGSLSGSNAGTISGLGGGIQSSGLVSLTSNSGLIQASGASGIGIAGAGVTITANTGTISGGATAISTTNGASITNSSTISGGTNGITGTGDFTLTNNSGGTVSGGTTAVGTSTAATIGNSGTISSTTAGGVTVSAGTSANITNNASSFIQNSGSGGIVISSNSVTLTNSGTVQETGGGSSIAVFGGATNITNSGKIAANFSGVETFGITTITNNAGATIQATQAGNSAAILTSAATTVGNAGTIIGDLDGINTNTTAATTITNSGAITGTTRSGIRVNTAAITNDSGGTVTGATAIIFRAGNGASSVFNAGTITGTSGATPVAIQFSTGSVGNTLTLGPGSVIGGTVLGQGSDIFQLGGTGTDTFNLSGIGAALQYQGFSTFDKIGTSSWTVTGTGNQSWTVEAGNFLVDGTINGAVNVTGGLIGGTGSVGSTTIANGATLAPGSHGVGTLTVSGNLVLSSASLYLIGVTQSASGRTTATGTAAVAGTAQAVFQGTSFQSQYTILSAAGGRSGTFSTFTATDLPGFFTPSLTYTPTAVILTLTAKLAQVPGLNLNQANVAGAIGNAFNSGASLPAAFTSLFTLPQSALPGAFTQLSGEGATGAQQGAFELTTGFLSLLTAPNGSAAAGGGPALPFAPERAESFPTDVALAYGAMLKAPPRLDAPRWTSWAAAFGGSNRTNGDPAVVGSHDLAARAGAFAAGIDYHIAPDTIVGLALAGGGTSWSLSAGLGGGHSDAFLAGLYGSRQWGPAYLSGALSYASHWVSTSRTITITGADTLSASFDAQSFGGRLEGGYQVKMWAPFTLTPYAAVQAQSYRSPGYGESGSLGVPDAFALSYAAQNATLARSELGGRFDRIFAQADGSSVDLFGRAAWAHDWRSNPSLAATFIAVPVATFVVSGAAPPSDLALVTAGAEWRGRGGWSALAKFDGEFGRGADTYAGTAQVKYSW